MNSNGCGEKESESFGRTCANPRTLRCAIWRGTKPASACSSPGGMSNDIGSPMTASSEYRAKAEEFRAMAQRESNVECRREYERLAQCYVRLANLAERNSLTDLVYETPSAAISEHGNSKPSESAG